jgi:small conductance mechanosensitive channel
MKTIWETFVIWANSIHLAGILISIIVGAIIYKLAPIFAKMLVAILIRARGSRKIKTSERRKRLKTLSAMFATVIKVVVVLTVLFTILGDMNVNLVPLFASAGVAGVALGFGAQNIIKDLLAGFFVILENQYRVGDFIDVSGIGIPQTDGPIANGGTVEKITLRSTVLRDRLGNKHFIPNGAIVQVVNKTMGFSKVHFVFGVASDTDMDKLIEVINEVGHEMMGETKWKDKIIDPPHFSEVGKIGADGFNITVNGTTEPADQWDVSSEFRKRLLAKMQHHEINTIETVG